jgi:hypothetical protein
MHAFLALAFLASPAALPPGDAQQVAASLVASGITEAELAKALSGKVPTRSESFVNEHGKDAGRGIGAIVIERPVGDVWNTLSHYEDRAEYVPHVKACFVLDRAPGRLRVRQEIDASVTKACYTAWYQLDETNHVIHWKLDDKAAGNTLADVDGEYRMIPIEAGRTLLVYRSYVDTGLKVPKFIQNYIAVRSMPDLLRAIKKRVESGGTWKKT